MSDASAKAASAAIEASEGRDEDLRGRGAYGLMPPVSDDGNAAGGNGNGSASVKPLASRLREILSRDEAIPAGGRVRAPEEGWEWGRTRGASDATDPEGQDEDDDDLIVTIDWDEFEDEVEVKEAHGNEGEGGGEASFEVGSEIGGEKPIRLGAGDDDEELTELSDSPAPEAELETEPATPNTLLEFPPAFDEEDGPDSSFAPDEGDTAEVPTAVVEDEPEEIDVVAALAQGPRLAAADQEIEEQRTWTEELRKSTMPDWDEEPTKIYDAESLEEESRALVKTGEGRNDTPWQDWYRKALSGPLVLAREVYSQTLGADPRVPPLSAPDSVTSNRYRILGHKVEEAAINDFCRTVAITSSGDGEGKTVTAVNLAMVLAEEPGRRVALVDLNLRSPSLAQQLDLPDNEGLLGVFLGRVTLPTAMLKIAHRELYVLPAGEPYPNPIELLRSGVFRAILRRLEDEFDFVIIDGPSILPKADIQVITRLVDRVVVVVAAEQTKDAALVSALKLLDEAKVLGLVLNQCAA